MIDNGGIGNCTIGGIGGSGSVTVTEEMIEAGVRACAVWRLGHCDEELAVLVADIWTAMKAAEPPTTVRPLPKTQLEEAMEE